MRERNGAPRHDDDKLDRIVRAAVAGAMEEQNSAIVTELRAMLREQKKMVQRLNAGMERIIDVVEGFQAGERDTAVAGLTDEESDDLPTISRLKVSPSSIFTLTGSQVAQNLGIRPCDASFLLSQKNGLDFLGAHPDLWDHETFKRTNRRLWHPRAVALLAEILDEPGHNARADISAGCKRVIARCEEARREAALA
jgi:hypothetical protein